MTILSSTRRLIGGIGSSRGGLLTAVLALVVVAAMVAASVVTRDDADAHRQAEVVVEQLQAASQQMSAFKWQSDVEVLTDRSGAPLRDAQVQATAERPLGPPETTHLVFRAEGAGRYVADAALTMPGQWELQLSASAQGHTIAATRRIVVVSTPLPLKRERSAQSAG